MEWNNGPQIPKHAGILILREGQNTTPYALFTEQQSFRLATPSGQAFVRAMNKRVVNISFSTVKKETQCSETFSIIASQCFKEGPLAGIKKISWQHNWVCEIWLAVQDKAVVLSVLKLSGRSASLPSVCMIALSFPGVARADSR